MIDKFNNLMDAIAWLNSLPVDVVVNLERMDTIPNPRNEKRNRMGQKNYYPGWRVRIFKPVVSPVDFEYVSDNVIVFGDGETLLEAINMAFDKYKE